MTRIAAAHMGGSLAQAQTGTAVAVARAKALGYLRKVPSDRATPVVVPERFNAAAFFLDRHLSEGRGGRTAFRFAGRAVTYEDVGRRANRLGNALRARGVAIEQRVLLALPDRPEFAEAFWGAMKLGAVPVPVSEALSADEYAFILNDSRARAVVSGEGAAEAILSVRAPCPWLAAVIAVGRPRRGALAYERLLERASAELSLPTRVGTTWRSGLRLGRRGRPRPRCTFITTSFTRRSWSGRGSSESAPTTSSSRSRSSTSALASAMRSISRRAWAPRPCSCPSAPTPHRSSR
jgi:hypothetical protein